MSPLSRQVVLFGARYTPQRAVARVRAQWPLLFFAPSFLLGQFLVSWVPHAGGWIPFGIGACAISAAFLRKTFLLEIGLVTGVVTGYLGALQRAPLIVERRIVTLRGVVAEEPRYRHPGAVDLTLDAWRAGDGRPLRLRCRAVDLPWRNVSSDRGTLAVGTPLLALAELKPFSDSPNEFERWLQEEGMSGHCRLRAVKRAFAEERPFRERVRSGLLDRLNELAPSASMAATLRALALGARDQLSVQREALFRDAGLMHILVLSGYQVAILFHFISALFVRAGQAVGWRLIPLWCSGVILARWLGLLVAAGLMWVLGIEHAGARALLALAWGVVAHATERNRSLIHLTLATLVVMSAWEPGCLRESGVQLTFLALLGIAMGQAVPHATAVERYLSVMTWATLCTMPVVVATFGTFSPSAFIANPLFVPVISYIGVVGTFLSLCISLLSSEIARGMFALVGWSLDQIEVAVAILAGLPGATFQLAPWCRYVLGGGVFILILRRILEALRGGDGA